MTKPSTVAITAHDRRTAEEKVVRDMQTVGWIEVSEDDARFVDRLFELGQRWGSIAELLRDHKLNITPADLGSSPLRNATLHSVMLAGSEYQHGFTGLTRLMVDPDLDRVALVENDVRLTGEGIHIPYPDLHSRYNGRPMVYVVSKAPSGHSFTTLMWSSDDKEFQLYVNVPVLRADHQKYVFLEKLMSDLT